MAIPIAAAVPSTCTAPVDAPDNSLASRQFRRRVDHIWIALAMCLLCFTLFWCVQTPVFAEGDAASSITSAIMNAIKQFWGVAKYVAYGGILICLIIAGFEYQFGGQRGGQLARNWFIGGLAGVIFVVLAPTIGNFIFSIFSDSSGWIDVSFS